MKISYNWLQSFFAKKLPAPEETADLLLKHSFEVESVKKQNDDWILDVTIMPNRAHDCASHWGVARELGAILGCKLKTTDYAKQIKWDKSRKINDFLKVEIQDKKACLRYTALALPDVKIGPAPEWIKKRLQACGLNSINNVVDVANYVMLETGQPLHAFDADKIAAVQGKKTIIVRRAMKGEKIVTLDKQNFDLDESILLIADSEKPLCIAGIKGGQGAEVDEKTKNIILEAANFDPLIIRKASKKLKLETDASWRFERDLDANLTKDAIKMAAGLIQQIAQGQARLHRYAEHCGQAMEKVMDVYPKKIKPKTINLDLGKTENLLGIKIPASRIKTILSQLGFKAVSIKTGFKVAVPTFRKDISILEDLVEEIARIYGLEKIASQMPAVFISLPADNPNLTYRNKVKDVMVGLGFYESYNRSLVGFHHVVLFNHNVWEGEVVELTNPLSEEQKYLRTNLVYGLLKDVVQSKKYFPAVRLFELGRVFSFDQNKKIAQGRKLSAVISFDCFNHSDEDKEKFYYLKGVIDLLLNKIGIDGWRYDDSSRDNKIALGYCDNSKMAEIKIENDCLGWVGEINQEILDKTGVSYGAAAFELDFEKLVELASEKKTYVPVSIYPTITRDVALLVEPQTKVGDVLAVIKNNGGNLVQDISLFDLYEDKKLGAKKSLAFHIIYQSSERNLTDKEVNLIQEKITAALKEKGWEVRK